ncbi:MAG TPA: hypothetical protein VHQ90_02300 [Thermoanaerobaculia bacterium]|nr:hypothetical protein [Thermoanaerobaculia bacterium]
MSFNFKDLAVSFEDGPYNDDGCAPTAGCKQGSQKCEGNSQQCKQSQIVEYWRESQTRRRSRELEALQQALTELLARGSSDLEAAKLQGSSGRVPGELG